MPFAVQDLIDRGRELVCVKPTDSVDHALEVMIEKDFSQLPVVDDIGQPLGLITSDSILRALEHFGLMIESLSVSSAMTKPVTRREEDDLFEVLDLLRDICAVLVVDGQGKLIGIVTSRDAAQYFRRRAEDMMFVEDIESALREHIEAAFTDPTSGELNEAALVSAIQNITDREKALRGRFERALRRYLELQGVGDEGLDRSSLDEVFSVLAVKVSPKSLEDLTLYEYTELLLHRSCVDYCSRVFDLDPSGIRNLLDSVRAVRNDLAHFRGEISARQRKRLHFCADWLERYPVSIPVDWTTSDVRRSTEPIRVQESKATYAVSAVPSDDVAPTDEELSPSDSRYAPLALWLHSQRSSRDRVQLSFEDIEEIIGGDLPASARRHRAWWANDSVAHTHSQLWLEVGWRTAQVNVTGESVTFTRIKEREKAYIAFFSALQEDMRGSTTFPFRDLGPDGQSWLTGATLPEGGPQYLHFIFSFTRGRRFRVELYIDTLDQGKNKRIFDRLHVEKDQFTAALGMELAWERLGERRASRVALYRSGSIVDGPEQLAQLRAWAVDAMSRFYQVFAGPAVEALVLAEQSKD